MLWRRPPLRWLVMTAFASPSCSFASAPSSSPMLVQERGYTLVSAAFMLSVTQFAGVTGRIVCGWLADRMGNSLPAAAHARDRRHDCCPVTALISAGWPNPVVARVLLHLRCERRRLEWPLRCGDRAAQSAGAASIHHRCGIGVEFRRHLVGPAAFATAYRMNG